MILLTIKATRYRCPSKCLSSASEILLPDTASIVTDFKYFNTSIPVGVLNKDCTFWDIILSLSLLRGNPVNAQGRFGSFSPFDQSQFNIGGLAGVAGNLVDAAVTNLTGNRFLGDLSGVAVSNLL